MSDPKSAAGELVEISRLELESSSPAEAIITDVKHLASYNWIEAPTPTIAVPGSPAQWSAPQGSRRVKKDSGFICIAQNAFRHPESPLEPLFRSLYIEQPSFDINSIDVVTDRNNIRMLLSFINPTKKSWEPFTIQVDMAAQTAILCRDETATFEVIKPGQSRGFGREFEKAYTVAQIKGSTGHHRIISYRLGGLSFLVRHETDGYVDNLNPAVKSDESTENNLTDMLKSLSLSPETASTGETFVQSKLTIKREGRVIPLESTLEIKTRTAGKHLRLREVAPQLWVSQTPKLVRAYHRHGEFSMPIVEDVTAQVKDWERAYQDDIRKLIALINDILRVTSNWGGSSTIRYDPLKDKLVIKKVERKKMLPDDLYSRWTKIIPATVAQKISEQGPAPTQKSDNQGSTNALDKDEALSSGFKAEPTQLRPEENVVTATLVNKSEP